MSKRCVTRPLALGLSLLLLLATAGCGKSKTSIGPTPTPAAAESPEPEGEQVDFSKYNSYVEVNDVIYDMSNLLDSYFAAVEYGPEFALVEGADYGGVRDSISTDITLIFPVDEAMDWVEKEPSYPDVDAAMKKLGPDLLTLMKQFGSLEMYMVFSEFEEDSYAKAAECHAEIYKAAQGFETWAPQFLTAMNTLTDETSSAELERLEKEGELIAYYSNLTIDGAQEVLDEAWAMLLAEEGSTGDAETLIAAYESFREDSGSLLENMEDEEQIKKIDRFENGTRYGDSGATYVGYYKTDLENLRYYMETLMEKIAAEEDYTEALETVTNGISNLIDGYNSYIAG